MRILISNDDGIHAPGLEVLKAIAHEISDDVWVVAPETDQSGQSHSLTLNTPLRLRRIDGKTFAVDGTPSDCVIMGVREVLPDTPDLVLSGVNAGQNISYHMTYSGTVAAAREGALLGVKSIALSQAYGVEGATRKIHWETARHHAPKVLDTLLSKGWSSDTVININFPHVGSDAVKGVRATYKEPLAFSIGTEKRFDGRTNPYYWLKLQRRDVDSERSSDTDKGAIDAGYISVSPIKLDMTDHQQMSNLVNQLNHLDL